MFPAFGGTLVVLIVVVVLLLLVVVPLPALAPVVTGGADVVDTVVKVVELAAVDKALLVVETGWLSPELELAEDAREEEAAAVAVGMIGVDVVVAAVGLAGTGEVDLVKQGMKEGSVGRVRVPVYA